MATLASLRADTVDYIRFRLGDGMVDVELDPEHYDNSIDKALKRFRQRSQNAYESSYVFLSVVTEQQEYTLPDEIEEVRQAFRRSVGSGQVILAHSLNHLKQHFRILICCKVVVLAVWQHMKCTTSIRN
jgi:hypothetical protein